MVSIDPIHLTTAAVAVTTAVAVVARAWFAYKSVVVTQKETTERYRIAREATGRHETDMDRTAVPDPMGFDGAETCSHGISDSADASGTEPTPDGNGLTQ
jgi:hypothetical protein